MGRATVLTQLTSWEMSNREIKGFGGFFFCFFFVCFFFGFSHSCVKINAKKLREVVLTFDLGIFNYQV